tara:strand:+ start:580 stop:762 length:183 start_codon:yes stop_codon:yes gene_type:complete
MASKEEQLNQLLEKEREWTMMFDSDVRVGLALLEEIRKLNKNKEEPFINYDNDYDMDGHD